ncbi:SCO6880 family protein [Dermabacteraceae bacterium P13115]
MNKESARKTYGNLTSAKRQTIWGMSIPMLFSALAVLFITVLFMLFGKWQIGIPFALIMTVVMLPFIIQGKHNRTLADGFILRAKQRRAEKAGTNQLIGGPAGPSPDGKFRMPGIGAQTEVTDEMTPLGVPFGLIHVPHTNHWTVVLEVHPSGRELVDQTTIDSQVAHWGAWLALLSSDENIVAASVTVETSIDSGLRLSRAVLEPVSDGASPFGRAVAEELSHGFGQKSPAITTRIALTFSGKLGKHTRSREEVVADIANALPNLMGSLSLTGAGTHVKPSTSQDLCDYVRAAFDPHVATQIEAQRAAGGTGLTWDQAGPAFHRTELDLYRHDRAMSVSWTLGGPMRGVYFDSSLDRLLSPDHRVARKRVTLLYRPIMADKATEIAQQRVTNADFQAKNSRNAAVTSTLVQAARQTALEEASGAGMTRFGMVVTATVLSEDDLPMARRVIASQSAQARLQIRSAIGSQDTAFLAGLPLGLVLPYHTTVSAELTDNII